MHEKKKKDSNPKTFKISNKKSPKTPDTVKRPYKHNDTDLWDRGSINICIDMLAMSSQ